MTQKQATTDGLSPLEQRTITGLAAIFAMRMLGLFMILPVFTLSAQQYSHSTPILIGFAIGAYGLSQAILQIPFGILSDRIGRKKVIYFGLVLFALGSVVAALADSIYTVILGRLLQGSGAIAAVIMALTADLTRDEQRTKAMAVLGISIGFSFTIALASGAALESWVGLHGLFWATAIMALISMALLKWWVPTPYEHRQHQDMRPAWQQLKDVFANIAIMRMVISILILHLLLTLSFFALPIALQNEAGIEKSSLALTYLPVMLLAFVAMVPFIIVAEKYRKMKTVFMGSIATLVAAQIFWFSTPSSLVMLLIGLWLFFTAFNILEASLPSMMSKLSPIKAKGSAMGVYSTAQFVGAFLGGVLGGVLFKVGDIQLVFLSAAILGIIWLLLMLPMQAPKHYSNRIIALPSLNRANVVDYETRLRAIPGIIEAVFVVEEQVAYVKYHADADDFDQSALDAFA